MKSTVLHVSRYDFKDDSGNQVSGCKVSFLGEVCDPANSSLRGREVVTVSAPIAVFDRFQQVPGEYDLSISYRMSGGKPVLKLTDAAFLQAK